MAKTATAEAGQGKGLGTFLGLSREQSVQRTWAIFYCFSQAYEQGAGSEAELPGFEPAIIWDVGAAGGDLVCCTRSPAPPKSF